jgi:alkylation response protein AidB-like acyl-CoA dehydrogenase
VNPRISEEQAMLDSMIQRLCEDYLPVAALRAAEASDLGYSVDLWLALVEQGISGAQIPEAYGGLGLGTFEMSLIYERLGRALAFLPHFPSCVLGANLISAAGDSRQRQEWLPALVSGAKCLSVASLEPGGDSTREGVQLSAVAHEGRLHLNGSKHFVPFAGGADALIVLARSDQRISGGGHIVALLVDAKTPGIDVKRQANLAGEPYYAVVFNNVRVPTEALLYGGAEIWDVWREAMFCSLIPLAAQCVGAAACVHEMSVEYAKHREAFGRPIGGFQAIAHPLAEAFVLIEGCRNLVRQAACAKDCDKPFHRLAAMSKLQAGAMFRRVSSLAIQVHGGLGYTLDADPQLYFRRAKQWQTLNWGDDTLEREIADLTLGKLAHPGATHHV